MMHFIVIRYTSGVATYEGSPSISFDEIVEGAIHDEFDGELEMVLRYDPETGASTNITKEVANAINERTHKDEKRPFARLEAWLDQWGLEPYRIPSSCRRGWEPCNGYVG